MSYNCITKPKKLYTHLTHEEREIIMIKISQKDSKRSIAKYLNRSVSTICREIARNQDMRSGDYRALLAQKKADKRLSDSSHQERLKNLTIRNYVIERLKDGWSPEQIAGRLRKERNQTLTNHETIYQFIYNDRKDLVNYLVKSGLKRKKRGSAINKRANRIPSRTSINDRSEIIHSRQQIGHWEADTMISRQSKAALCVVTERKYRLTLIEKINRKTADEMKSALINRLREFPQKCVKTITYDNGLENAAHEIVNKKLGTKSYFCNPYRSWEKGTVENAIGLIRQYLPKKTDLNLIDNKEIELIEYALNNRPRKCLDYQTPWEAFNDGVALGT